jgi:D-serine deaminase-like pyridoxal phosphate-dependent protein
LLENAHIPVRIVSGGGTLTYFTTGHYPGISEIRPGGYALMDLNYRPFTSDFDCGLTVLGTVVSTPSRDRVIIDAGSTSVAKENVSSMLIHPEGWK